ncbi:cGMP-inhibited 3',5'-cyclic phosphodiesterase A [Bulinus truncatus]|nr:cGMP-inhibited 3',5'-cyclic phosphodiesterase A [Bulinus truncatus]
MALARNSVSRRSSKNELEKDDEDGENNGYIQVFVKPLEQGSCSYLFKCVASVFSSLETSHSAGVILLVSFTRFLACSALQDIPVGLRPFVAYSCGFAGNIVAKYMEAILKPQIQNYTTQDGKIPVIKRRRSSSSSAHAFTAHRSTRRTSLPALIQKSQSSAAGFESAILGEAHGLITDMLADGSLPPHIISGLKAVSNLLKPPDAQSSFHKPRVSPLVSLTESTTYGSDSEESPYTGERPSTLPKRLRRSLPPSLIRRMSTSTWTTTTSATGMPTLEPEPCRLRSSSFRHSREGTPGSSPNGSRSNSPSPASVSNSTTILTIPKSRSFSLASAPPVQSSFSRRFSRKSANSSEPSLLSFGSAPSRIETKQSISPLARTGESSEDRDVSSVKVLSSVSSSAIIQKRITTSDYESSDSPSSSDHSDNVYTSEEMGSLSKKELLRQLPSSVAKVKEKVPPPDDGEDDREREGDDEAEDDDDKMIQEQKDKSSVEKTLEEDFLLTCISKELKLLFDPEKEIEKNPMLNVNQLNLWDFPIFEVAESEGSYLLTKIAYRLFTEVGLMETFRIPLAEFLNYFHALELGYRNKPYHNRVHATDVLHGVYYLTTQPIPGFAQINPSDLISRNGSSSESDNENSDRPSIKHRASFMAEDSYGIMGGNLPALELMALYTAAAMHDYDHPGRTNAFLVATTAPQAVLYNDRSVLENHHAAAAWSLLLNDPKNYFITGLEAAEFKRFRYLVIEAILATDLKRHFEILAEFNAKVNDEESVGIDWTSETDRLLVTQMVIKLADINGPAKRKDLHQQWTYRIAEEFYEQGDEEASLGLPISPYMDRRSPQLAKLQETFINHLVAPLCNAMVTGGLLPGTWVEEDQQEFSSRENIDQSCGTDTQDEDNDTDNESGVNEERHIFKPIRKVNCLLTKNLKENYEFWLSMIRKEEEDQKKTSVEVENSSAPVTSINSKDQGMEKLEMEPIKEESESPPLSAAAPPTPPHQANTVKASHNSAFQSTSSS